MPYRMGRGDYMPGYYQGDPGIFGAIGHVLAGTVGGFLTGGPLGAIRGAIGGTVSGIKAGITSSTLAAGGSQSALTPQLRAAHAQALKRGALIAARAPGIVTGGVAPARISGGGGRRRMNPLNIKALRRANRRAHGFLRAVRSAVRYYTPKQPKGKAYVHFKKRRAA